MESASWEATAEKGVPSDNTEFVVVVDDRYETNLLRMSLPLSCLP